MFTRRNLTVLRSIKGGSFDYDPSAYTMPVTDKNKAHAEFVNTRTGGTDVSGDSAHAPPPADQGQKPPTPEEEKKKKLHIKIPNRRKPSKEKEARRALHALSYLTPAVLDPAHQVREKELVRYTHPRYHCDIYLM